MLKVNQSGGSVKFCLALVLLSGGKLRQSLIEPMLTNLPLSGYTAIVICKLSWKGAEITP